MNIAGAFLLLVFGYFSVEGQSLMKRNDDGISGPVRSVEVERAVITKTGGRDVEGSRRLLSRSRYGPTGLKLEEERYDEAGDLSSRILYEYDSRGLSKKETQYDPTNSVLLEMRYARLGNVRAVDQTIYDATGHLISHNVMSLDESGQEIGLQSYDQDGIPDLSSVIRRDGRGRPVEISFFAHRGGVERKVVIDQTNSAIPLMIALERGGVIPVEGNSVLLSREVFTHEDTTEKVVEATYDASGQLVRHRFLLGDASSLKSKVDEYDASGGAVKGEERIRVFDSEGNWTEERFFERDIVSGKYRVRSVTYRRIQYFSPKG